MKHFSIFFFLLFTFSNIGFAQKDQSKLKTTGEELREQNISNEELCNIACQSEFRKCYNDDKKNSWPCLTKTMTCKNQCKKEAEKK